MRAFISYSHKNTDSLQVFHTHLAQMKRDHLIDAWADQEIPTGSRLHTAISGELARAQLFIALLSPDYIASNYCYEKEFDTALGMEKQGQIIIVPIIVEPCDWLSTPFSAFNALPKDGKPISDYSNINTAFLDVIQQLRKLVQGQDVQTITKPEKGMSHVTAVTKNYRIKKDFDSIHRLEFVESSFEAIKKLFHEYITEIQTLENIKVREVTNTGKTIELILVNRNKIDTEARLKLSYDEENRGRGFPHSEEHSITYTIISRTQPKNNVFHLAQDEYDLFWTEGFSMFYNSSGNERFTVKDMADRIWEEWLGSVGII